MILKIILPLVSLAAFVFFIYKFEYVVVLGTISSAFDQTDFFNTLFFFTSLCLGLITGWFLFSAIFDFFKTSGNKKFLLTVLIIGIKIFSPYIQFQKSLWLNSVFCPTLTLHGIVSSFRDAAPEGLLGMAKSMRERCVLKNFMEKRVGDRASEIQEEYQTFIKNIPNIKTENIPLFAITELNVRYPYFDKEVSLDQKLEAMTATLEGINLIFKKSSNEQLKNQTMLDAVLNFSNDKVMDAFKKSFALYMNREIDKIRAAYLSELDQSNFKVNFDFMMLRYELLKENLGVIDE